MSQDPPVEPPEPIHAPNRLDAPLQNETQQNIERAIEQIVCVILLLGDILRPKSFRRQAAQAEMIALKDPAEHLPLSSRMNCLTKSGISPLPFGRRRRPARR